ncbi:MAG: Hpt domain-containing protein [Firmicutes bacterium]|nr:Hpt domain-containing protein [Bacillota bacterium]MBQ9605196.1 Hpt domain-containing protein [Bacillota bacterium]
MLTTESLKQFGANVDEALVRCMNDEGFYIMLVNKVKDDKTIEKLEKYINDKDLENAFEAAHTLKGMYANLSLAPLEKPMAEMTELLRGKTDTDYSALLEETKKQFEILCAL